MKRVILIITLLSILLPIALDARDGGDVIWSYYADVENPWDWHHIRSIKNIADVNGDGHEDALAVSENDTLYCLSGEAGDVIWTFTADPCFITRGLTSVPDLDNDGISDVMLGTIWGTKKVFAISGATGGIIWQYDTHEYGTGGWIYEVAPMSDMDGDGITDILASAGGDAYRAYLFSGATGTKIWEYSPGPYAVFGIREAGDLNGDSNPDVVITTGNYVASAFRTIALNGSDGSELWNVGLTSTGWTVTPIGDIDSDDVNDVAVGTMDGKVIAFSGDDGTVIWTRNIGGTVVDLYPLPDINEDGIPELLPSGTGMSSFYCIDGLTGNVIWSTSAADQVFTSVAIPDISGDGIWDVVGGTGFSSCVFYAMDGLSGDNLWTKNMSSSVESAWWIEDIDNNGSSDILVGLRDGWIYALADGNPVGVDDTIETQEELRLYQNYPNPFNTSTLISYNLATNRHELTRIKIYNVKGQVVKQFSIVNNKLSIEWDGKDESGSSVLNGIYFYQIEANNFKSKIKKMVLIR